MGVMDALLKGIDPAGIQAQVHGLVATLQATEANIGACATRLEAIDQREAAIHASLVDIGTALRAIMASQLELASRVQALTEQLDKERQHA